MDEADAAEFDGANLALELDLPVRRGESCAGVAAEDACEAGQRQEAEDWSFRGLKSPLCERCHYSKSCCGTKRFMIDSLCNGEKDVARKDVVT